MKKYGIIAIVVVAIAAIGIAGWKLIYGRDDSMASSLPADVTMIGRMDLKTMLVDYGLDLADLKELLASEGAEETGIKYQTAAYFFASQGHFGAIVALSDDDDFEAFLTKQGCTIEEQRGLKWSVIDGNALLAFNDDRAMLMGPAVGAEQDALRNTIAACMKQKASVSGKQSRLYKLLDKRDEPLALATNLQTVADAAPLKVQTPQGVSPEDVNLMAGFTAHKDRLTLSFALDTDNKAVEKQMKKMSEGVKPIKGALVQTTPPNPLFHMEMGIDGEDLIEMMRENNQLRTALLGINMVFDLDMILKAIDGDVALTCLDYADGTPSVLLQAQVENDKFMKKVTDWNDAATRAMGLSFYSQDEQNGVCLFHGMPVYFGTQKKRLSISNTESLVKADGYADVKTKLESEVKGNLLYVTVSVDKARQLVDEMYPVDVDFLRIFDRLTLTVRDAGQMRIDLVAHEGVDILKELKQASGK